MIFSRSPPTTLSRMHDPIGRALMLRILPCAARGISPYFPAALLPTVQGPSSLAFHPFAHAHTVQRQGCSDPSRHRRASFTLAPYFHIPNLLHHPLHISSVGYSPDFVLRLASHDASDKSSLSVATRSHPINLSSLIALQIVRHFHPYHAHAFGVTFHQNS